MDFSPYQAQGKLNAPNQNYTDPLRVSYNNAGAQALARENGKLGMTFWGGALAYKEQVDSAKSLEANNEYNRLMSEGTAELMQRKQEKALNIVEDYDKLQSRTLETIKKKYGSYINYGKAAVEFNNFTTRDNATRRANMLKYQLSEIDAFHETQFNNQMADCAQMVSDGGYSDDAIAAGVNRALPLVENRYANYGNAMIQQQMQAAKRGMVENALSFFTSMGNYSRIKDLCQKYRDVISPGKMSSMLALVGKRQEEAKELALQQRMWSDLGPNATPSQVEAWADNYLSQARRSGNQEGIPLYKQWDEDWADVPFSNGTLGTSGCAPTSLAMELSWFLGEYVSPVEVANYATSEGLVDSDGVHGSKFIPAVAKHYGVEMRQTDDKEEVIDLLRRGVPVVAAHDPGMFTDYGHFLVYTGIDADGRVMINDPNGGVRHSDDATFSLDEIFNQESADYYVPDNLQDIARRQNEGFNNVEIDEVKADEIKKKLSSDYKHRQSLYKAEETEILRQAKTEMQDLMNHDVTDVDQYQEIADRYATNREMQVELEKTVASIRRRNEKAVEQTARSQPSVRVDEADMNLLRNEISKGAVTESDIINYCAERGITAKQEINKCLKLLKDYTENKGEWAIPYKEIKEYCGIDEKNVTDKQKYDITINKVARWKYKEMLYENNGNLPEGWEQELEKRVKDSFEKEYHGVGDYRPIDSWGMTPDVLANEQVIISNADLMAAGFIGIEQIGNGNEYWLLRDDGSKTYMTGEDVMKLKGMSGYVER